MIGDTLHSIARRLLHPHTCASIVTPAIADLQHEAHRGPVARVRGYLGVWRALAAAVVFELADDCAHTVRAVRFGSIAAHVSVTLLVTSVVFLPRWWFVHRNSPAPWHHELVLFVVDLPEHLAVLMPTLAVPIAAALAGTSRGGSKRAALLMAAMPVMLAVVLTQAVEWHLSRLRFDLFYSSRTSVRAGTQDRPLWDIQQAFAAQREAVKARDERVRARMDRERGVRSMTPIDAHRFTAGVLMVIPYVVLGILWSRKSSWMTIALGAATFAVVTEFAPLLGQLLHPRSVPTWIVVMWMPAVLLIVLCAFAALHAKTERAG